MRLILVLAVTLLISGCVKYPLIASFEDIEDRYIGVVNSNMLFGVATVNAISETDGNECNGNTKLTAMPVNSFGCAGQIGEVVFECGDGRKAAGEFKATSCTSGYGQGIDSNGNKFNFYFGDKAKELIDGGGKPEIK
ncbi:MAG: hypothetical protein OQJ97_12380 [Rhodospirillales bacterium]|nr:hypothetical protein [Rhodospirillales bacterium]